MALSSGLDSGCLGTVSRPRHTAVLHTVPAQWQRRRHQRVSRYLLLLWTAQQTVDTRHFLLRLRTGIGSVWRWVDADDYRPPALLVQEKRHLDGRWPGGLRLLPRVACFGDPVTKLRQVKQTTLGMRWALSTASYLRLEAAPHPHRGVVSIAAGQEEPPITTLWPCVSSQLQSAQSRHSGSPRSIRRRKLFPTSPPSSPSWIGKLQS